MTFSRLPVTLQESSREAAKVSDMARSTVSDTSSCPTSLETLLSRRRCLSDHTLTKPKICCQIDHF